MSRVSIEWPGRYALILLLTATVGCEGGSVPGSPAAGAGIEAGAEAPAPVHWYGEGERELEPPAAPAGGDDTRSRTDDPGVGDVEVSRCELAGLLVTCDHQTTVLHTGLIGAAPRDVHWQVPVEPSPAAGWPAVIVFQGSLFSASLAWSASEIGPLGAWHQTMMVKGLLDAGYAVVMPEAHLEGSTWWDTNVPPFNLLWETSPDHALMVDLFAAIEAGELGAIDADSLYAVGISSGGYMTSRMAVSYPGRFRALAVHSASYATCGGAVCLIPPLPDDHPPTLFLHGALDPVVPLWTADAYRGALEADGVATELLVEPLVAHEWIAPTPDAVREWFAAHP